MSRPASQLEDLEGGNIRDDHLEPQSTPDPPSQGESIFGDSSRELFSMYSKAVEEDDNKKAESVQKDAEGLLIFSGLFSAAVAAFLTVSVQDLRPNSQDTSNFYLGHIYEVLADPNITRASNPYPVAEPPSFSPRDYAVWVNSLWFLSLVLSLISALWAMSLQQWARHYLAVSQPSRCSPEMRARVHASLAKRMSISLDGTETLLNVLQCSLLLFFAGLATFLVNTDLTVFLYMCLLIPGLAIAYVILTQALPLSEQLSINLGLKAKMEISKQSWQLDLRILRRLIQGLDDDDTLERFFGAIPGFFNSKMVKHLDEKFPEDLLKMFWNGLNGFLCRTMSSNMVEPIKSRRIDIGMNAMNVIYSSCASGASSVLIHGWDQVPPIAEIGLGQFLTFCTSGHEHIAYYAQCIVAKILASVPERNDRWIQFAASAFGLPEGDLQGHGDDRVSFSIFIHLFRQSIRHRFYDLDALMAFSKRDIRHTLPELQHDFCALWNELVHKAEASGQVSNKDPPLPVRVLQRIRHLYIDLHQGTDAAPTAFSASTDTLHSILHKSSSYPLCDIASHRPGSTSHLHINSRTVSILSQPDDSPGASPYPPSHGGTTVPQQANSIVRPPSPSHQTTTGEIQGPSRVPLVFQFSTHLVADALQTGSVAPVLQDITSATTLSHLLENNIQTSPSAPEQTSDTLILNNSLTSCDAGVASTSSPFLPAPSVVGVSIPASPPPSHVLPLPNVEFLTPLNSTILSRSTGNATLPHLRARGLVNTGSICFSSAVLQLLLHSPPFWNLFRELGDLKGRRGEGGPQIGGDATPLVDATVRFFEEFVFKEEPPPVQRLLEQAEGGKAREDEEAKKEHNAVDSFEPAYMYDAMKEKRQLNNLLDGHQQDAEEFFRLYLDALDEELLALLTLNSTHKADSAAPGVDEREVSQSGLTEVGERGFTANFVDSPTTRIFGGKFRSTVRAPNQPDTVTVEDWRSLQLNIQPDSVLTIQDSLVHISQPQPVQIGQPNSIEASQQVQIEVLPPVLVLHLKRFLYDATAEGIVKISKAVQLSPELEIPLEIMAPVVGKSLESAHYKLYGVLYHNGESADRGHYSVDVLHPDGESDSGETWLHIDDEAVRAVRHEDVFWGHDNERADERCAYMLFYRRTSPAKTR